MRPKRQVADEGARATAITIDPQDGAGPADGPLPAESITAVAGLLDGAGPMRRSADADDPLGGTVVDGAVQQALRRRQGSGSPLPGELSGAFGDHFAQDLSGVRVHHDAEAGTIARSLSSTAFTHGSDVYFAPGAYQPESEQGRRLIAHELSHVVAQRTGADRGGSGPLSVGRAADPAEAAADRSADAAISALRRQPAAPPKAPGDDAGVGASHVRRSPLPATHPLRRNGVLLGGHRGPREPQTSDKPNSMSSGKGSFSGSSTQTTDVPQGRSDLEGGSTGRHTETTHKAVAGTWNKGEVSKDVRNGKSVVTTTTSHDHLAGAEAWAKTITEASDTQLLAAFQARARAGAFSSGSGSKGYQRGQVGVGASGGYDAMAGVDTGVNAKASVDTSGLIPALEAAASAYVKGGVGLDAQASVLARLWKLEFVATGKVSMFAGFEASASGRAFFNGVEGMGVEGKAGGFAGGRVGAAGMTTLKLGPAELIAMASVEGKAGAWANAAGKVAISLTGVEITGAAEAFAGVAASASASGTAKFRGKTIVSAKGTVTVAAGIGGKVKGGFALKGGKLKLDFGALAVKGIGGGVDLKLEVDFEALGYAICTTIWEQYTNYVNEITEDAGYIPRDPLIDAEEAARVKKLAYDAYIHDFRAYAAEKLGGSGKTGLNRERVQKMLDNRRGQLGTALTHVEADLGIDEAAQEAFGPLLRDRKGFQTQAGVIRVFDAVLGSGIGKAREDFARSSATDALRAALSAGATKTRSGSGKTKGTNAPDFDAVNKVLGKSAPALIRTFGDDKAGADAAIASLIQEVYQGLWSNVVVRDGKLSSAKVDFKAIERADSEMEEANRSGARVAALAMLQSECAAYAATQAKSAKKPIRKDKVAEIIAKHAAPLTGSGQGSVVDRVITDMVIRGLGASVKTFIYSDGEIRAFEAADPAEVNKAYLEDQDAKRRTELYEKAKRDFAAYVTEKTKSGENGVKQARIQKIVDDVVKKVGPENLAEADAALTIAARDALGPMVNFVKIDQGKAVVVVSQTKSAKLKQDYQAEKEGRGRYLGDQEANERRYLIRKMTYQPLQKCAAALRADPHGVPSLREIQRVVDESLGPRSDVLTKQDAREYLVALIVEVFDGIVSINIDEQGRLGRAAFHMDRLMALRAKDTDRTANKAALDALRTPLRAYAAKTATGRPTLEGIQAIVDKAGPKLAGLDGSDLDGLLQMAVMEAFGSSRIKSVEFSGGKITALRLAR